jgi:hypothetical protein
MKVGKRGSLESISFKDKSIIAFLQYIIDLQVQQGAIQIQKGLREEFTLFLESTLCKMYRIKNAVALCGYTISEFCPSENVF